MRQGDLKAAEELSRKAHALISVGEPTHASVAAALYQRGRIAMLQGNDDGAALEHFQKALVICKNNEPHGGNKGEAARVRWRMAMLCDRMGRVEEADRLRTEAEKVKRELLATREYPVAPAGLKGDEKEEAEWDALVGLLYR